MIPRDDFTPHGYLDNPYHSWKLNPSGVLRSMQPLGMGWHVPNLGTYARNQFQYAAHLTIGLKVGKLVLVTPEDFQRQGCSINSSLHTKNRFEYTCFVPAYGLTLTACYFLVHEHALGCVITLSSTWDAPLPVTCYLTHVHTHNPFTSRLWEHGLYAREASGESGVMLGIASEGDVFLHGVRAADGNALAAGEMGYGVGLEDISAWARGRRIARPTITQLQEETGWQLRALSLPCALTLDAHSETARTLNVVLSRGVSQDQAYRHWEDGIEEIARAGAAHRADDERFWRQAPQLSGDWPASWRRGLLQDLETLRMTIRSPVGVIPHPWDGMQIQAPRTVIAEAAMDCLFLSYADPELASEVMLGHFESAPHPQLPCMREDGSYNMVADDGQICGTAPEWGFPLWCCDQLFRRTGNLHWLRRLYPYAAAYLRWWLDNRSDAGGWLTYACSWESGQDVSSRFGPQQTGGTIIQHVRPVDLQASMAQGASILKRWATLLAQSPHTVMLSEAKHLSPDSRMPRSPQHDTNIDYNAEAAAWKNIADEFTVKTRAMWQHGWFRDYDSVACEWSTQQDTMHLAPVFCGVAGREHIERLRSYFSSPPMHSGWAPLCWPPVVMTLIGAASEAALPLEAAELAAQFIDAAYTSIDSRVPDEHGGLPGVTREYHQVTGSRKDGTFTYANAGIEGYGWGAISIHLLLRYVLGLREEEDGKLTVAPVLPQSLRHVGACYRVEPVQWGNASLAIECVVRDANGYALRLRYRQQEKTGETGENDREPGPEQVVEWEGAWGEGKRLTLFSP